MSSQLILIVEETRAPVPSSPSNSKRRLRDPARRQPPARAALLAEPPAALVLADINGQTLGLLDAVRGGKGLAGEIDPDTPMIVLTSAGGRARAGARVRARRG